MKEVTVTEAAKLLGVTSRQVHYLIEGGKLQARRVGYIWILDRAEVEEARRSREILAPLDRRMSRAQ